MHEIKFLQKKKKKKIVRFQWQKHPLLLTVITVIHTWL